MATGALGVELGSAPTATPCSRLLVAVAVQRGARGPPPVAGARPGARVGRRARADGARPPAELRGPRDLRACSTRPPRTGRGWCTGRASPRRSSARSSSRVYLFAGPVFAGGGLSWQTLPLALAVLVAAAFALGLVVDDRRARAHRRARAREPRGAGARRGRDRRRAGARAHRPRHARRRRALARRRDRPGRRCAVRRRRGSRRRRPTRSATISTTARSALADVRLLLAQLRHSQGDGPQPTLADLEELYAQVRAAGVDLRVDVDPGAAPARAAGGACSSPSTGSCRRR